MKLPKLLFLLLVTAPTVVLVTSCKTPRVKHSWPSPGPAYSSGADLRSDRFGVIGRTTGQTATRLLDELGVGWIRVPVNWGQVEPRQGDYKWREVSDAVHAETRARPGMQVMVTLHAKSPWAGRHSGVTASDKATIPPSSLDDYYEFVYGMARRGRGVVRCWQIENEMEGRSWWDGTSEEYLALLRTASRAVRAADPSAKVVLGGFTSETCTVAAFTSQGATRQDVARQLGYEGVLPPPGSEAETRLRRNVAFVDAVLAKGKDYFDIVDLHLYHRYETIPMRVAWLRSKMQANGYEKPIWATEVGGPDPAVLPHSDSAQAQEVVKRLALALASGVEKVFWLGLSEMDDQGARFRRMGLATPSGRRKEAFEAYRLTIRKLDELAYSSSLDVPGGYGFRFQGGPRGVWILWADRGAQFRLQTGASEVLVTRLDGREQRLAAKDGAVQFSLTASPVFVQDVAG